MSQQDPDVVIIGAGVIGAAAAYEMASRGWRTLSLDALPAAGFGSTSASCAIVRFTYSTYNGVAMAWEGLHYWTDWPAYLQTTDERGLASLVQCGTLLLKQPGGHHLKVKPLFDEMGIPYEDWDADQLRTRMPALDPRMMGPPKRVDDEAFWAEPSQPLPGAIWTSESGYVSDPQLASHNLQRAAEAKGARFRFSTKVVAVVRSNGRVTGLTLDDGSTVSAPVVVNVAGPHSAVINSLAGLEGTMKIGTRPLRHEVHHVAATPALDFEHTGCHVSDGDTGVYFRPEVGNSILVGSEDPECDTRDWVDDPDDFDRTITPSQWEAQVLRLARRIPDLGVPNERRGVVDLYDVADDWIPIYDRTDLDGFYVAIGTSGNQFKNAGVAGHCMAELIEAVEGGHDHDADPLVVKGRYTGLELDLGSFSRNRAINPDSSFSVNG
ncbi:MAG: FAD-binding oxidoreductase [Nocardioidaceae bacterium]|jgi:sarcosine oxidase subunit beta|nr:FAD-binding oxidoreductase [Nocardioidaceae bacterium]